MNRLILPAVALLLLAGCSKTPETQGPGAALAPSTEIAWVRPTAVTDVDRTFEQAKTASKPVFLFWTAAWCPPCNQVKSTIFTRPEFIAKSRSFVPVYVDGDTPSGQALGKRFSVSAYPTMVLLRPDGSEITRLAGWAAVTFPMYFIHLIFIFFLICYLPFSKMAHIVYRTAAMAYNEYAGRNF